jgi:hypothetical protein
MLCKSAAGEFSRLLPLNLHARRSCGHGHGEPVTTRPGEIPIDAQALRGLLEDHRIQMIGPIRQELLSGIRDARQFDRLAKHLPLVLYRPEDLV